MRYFFSIAFSLLASTSWAKELTPSITYIEDLIEKEVQWEVIAHPAINSGIYQGPYLKVWIKIPSLLKLKSIGDSSKIIQQNHEKLLYFETRERISLVEVQKSNSKDTKNSVVIKVSFPKGSHFYIFSEACQPFLNLMSFSIDPTVMPLVSAISCPSRKSLLIKTSPEIEFIGGKKQANYSSLKIPIEPHSSRKTIQISKKIKKDEIIGNLTLQLSQMGDVVEQFEKVEVSEPLKTQKSFKNIRSAGFTFSNKDPEAFGSFTFKLNQWRAYLNTSLTATLPTLLKGSLIKHPYDGLMTITAHRPFDLNSLKFTGAIGVEGIKSSRRYSLGPAGQISLDRLKSFSKHSQLGLTFIGSLPKEGQHHLLELRVSTIRSDGKHIEPKLIYQMIDLEDAIREHLFKVGVGVKF